MPAGGRRGREAPYPVLLSGSEFVATVLSTSHMSPRRMPEGEPPPTPSFPIDTRPVLCYAVGEVIYAL
jgi:hypothetical protein